MPLYRSVGEGQLYPVLRDTPNAQLLILSRMGYTAVETGNAQLIPLRELGVRAKYELQSESPVVVDCRTAIEPVKCQDALLILAAGHFNHLIAIDAAKRSKCSH